MTLYIGADHGGFHLKQALIPWLSALGHTVVDCGNTQLDTQDDFPDFAFAVADKVAADPKSRGIVICRSAGGVTIAANKVKGIRCTAGIAVQDVFHNRSDDDINVLALAGDYTTEETCKELLTVFLETPYAADTRFVRRLQKIASRE